MPDLQFQELLLEALRDVRVRIQLENPEEVLEGLDELINVRCVQRVLEISQNEELSASTRLSRIEALIIRYQDAFAKLGP